MERLSDTKTLEKFLGQHVNRDIVIVSAFASGTTRILSELVAKNRVELILGTINAFTSPDFIDEARNLLKDNLWVDFRGNASIHWKLYLVSPSTVVIGSANFTGQGIRLGQDTCVVIKSTALYNDYMEQIAEIKQTTGVLTASSTGFNKALERHREHHYRNDAALQAARLAGRSARKDEDREVPSFEEWAKLGFLTIPLFVWDVTHAEATKKEATRLLRASDAPEDRVSGVQRTPSAAKPWRDFLIPDVGTPTAPFDEGTLVLATNARGAYMRFMKLDRIIANNGKYFMIERRKTRYPKSFMITPQIRDAIARVIQRNDRQEYAISVDALSAEVGLSR